MTFVHVPVVSTNMGSGCAINKLEWDYKDRWCAFLGGSNGQPYVYDIRHMVIPQELEWMDMQKTIARIMGGGQVNGIVDGESGLTDGSMQIHKGNTHFIMNITINHKDNNTEFTSSCLDHTIKMWSIGSPTPNYTMDAHDKGINYIGSDPGADKLYLVTTSDKTIKVCDYLSKSCVQIMEDGIVKMEQ